MASKASGASAIRETVEAANSVRSGRGGAVRGGDPGVRAAQMEPAGIRTKGLAFTPELIRTGRVDLRGKIAGDPTKLAFLAQIHRDPRYETFRMIYVKSPYIPKLKNWVLRGFKQKKARGESIGNPPHVHLKTRFHTGSFRWRESSSRS